jgi:N-acetylmuramic acid 6-phosphate etherase
VNRRKNNILTLLKTQSHPQSDDYVRNKKQFQLHTLLTEQRHPRTWNLSFTVKDDVEKGWEQILSVDQDISKTFHHLAKNTALIDRAVQSVTRAIRERKKIFIYGCGSTGRLAKQMESALWRPFWKKMKKSAFWDRLRRVLPDDIEERLIGEMTGGDRALISALEGFEDLQIVGKLQLQDRGVERGDVVVCITEGGETSSVIGAILAACEQYSDFTDDKIDEAKNHLYFIYNNPDDVLEPFDRSRAVIENPAITKINLTTGPQAIAGSTRMQAATAETFVVGIILEFGIRTFLEDQLSDEELTQLDFNIEMDMSERLLSFDRIREHLERVSKDIAKLIRLESETYQRGNLAVYFASNALLTVFIDCAERSPTFHLYPLDTVKEKRRKCWLQVWTEGKDYKQAWRNLLGRGFRGLERSFYKPHFLNQIDDTYLKAAALNSLILAGGDQEELYNFSFSEENIRRRGPKEEDLGVVVCLDEEIEELSASGSSFYRFITLCKEKNARLAFILLSDKNSLDVENIISRLPLKAQDVVIQIFMERKGDPLNCNRQVLLKILLNSHSTAVMARLGRVVGNTMTHVNPSNLKLIGRATHLIMSHVNDTLSQEEWTQKHGKADPVTYQQANVILFEAMDFVAKRGDQISEVELSIIRVLEALRTNMFKSWEDALSVLTAQGLENYLERHNPALRRKL